MEAISAWPTASEALPFPAADNDLPLVLVSIELRGEEARFFERKNSSAGVVHFKDTKALFVAMPVARGASLPYIYRVHFRAENFVFADPAVAWKTPSERPPWIAEPRLRDGGELLEMTVVDATKDAQLANFDLLAAHEKIVPIDPTIVNNPDGGP